MEQPLTDPIKKINWINLSFFILTPSLAVAGIVWRLGVGGIPWATWVLAVVMAYATGVAVTAGYHRLLSHKSYEAAWPIRLLLLLFGGAAFEASARWWCSEHRYHHRFVDTERDPYGINKGFWYAHIGWLIRRRDPELGFDNIKDLDKDRLILWQDRYYLPLAVAFSFGLPIGIASLWGDPWGGLFVAGLARIVLVHHWTWCINSVTHTFGKQTYSDQHSGRDNWFAAYFTWGEGYHNFHHEFPSDYRNGHRFYHWDPGKWLIRFLAFFNLSRNLRRTDKVRILTARLLMDRKRVAERLADSEYFHSATEMLDKTLERIQSAYRRFLILKAEYLQVKKTRLESFSHRLKELRNEIQEARREFRDSLGSWKDLLRGPLPLQVHQQVH